MTERWSHWVPKIEQIIIGIAIDIILAQGNVITVWDGEDAAISFSSDKDAIIETVAETDVTVFTIFNRDKKIQGWIVWVHGNHEDVLADASVGKYTTELIEEITEKVNHS